MHALSWTAIGLTTLACLLPTAQAQRPAKDGPAAIVNGTIITRAQVEAELHRRPPVVTPLGPTQMRYLRREILNGLIDELLVRQFLARHAPPIDEKEVTRRLVELETAQVARGKTLADYYRQTGQTEAQVRAAILQLLQLDAWAKSRCTPEALKKYYQDNKDFFEKVRVRARHIVLTVPPGAAPAEKEAVRKQLLDLRARIASGALDFGTAAKQYSQCPSAARGGDLGFFLRKWMVDDAFAKAAFALKPGELSGVVESDVGLHLIQVMERQPGTPTTFEQCVAEVRESFTEELRQSLLANLRKQARIEIK